MAYIGIKPAESFTSFATQTFSTSATSSYTLDHAVTNENELALFINNVRQQPGSGKAYTATGTALTLSANTASTDTMYAIFLGRALQTVNPADGSVATASIAATAVTGAKLNTDTISAQTALAAEPADTDEFLVSDAGVLKRIDYSLIKGSSTHTLLSTTTVSSAVAQVDITSNIDSTYKSYMFKIINMHPATDAAEANIRFFQGGSVVEGTAYEWAHHEDRSDGNTSLGYSGGAANMILAYNVGNAGGQAFSADLELFDPAGTTFETTFIHHAASSNNDEDYVSSVGGGKLENTTAVTGVRFYFSSGNIDAGVIKLYGIT